MDFTYDGLHRLTIASSTLAATTDYRQTYAYNAIGNITNKSDIGDYTYTDSGYNNPHAATSINSITNTYDNNGNLLDDGTWSHSWDYDNHIASSTNGTVTINYENDQDGQRVEMDNGTDDWIYPNRYYNLNSATTTKQIFANGQLIATIEGNGIATSTYYVLTDHLTGSNAILNEEGEKVQILTYDPFGGERVNEKTESFSEQRQFTGYERDTNTGLDYAGARYYRNTVGRFNSIDPLFLDIGNDNKFFRQKYNKDFIAVLSVPQELNSYSYALNNPLLFKDPNGCTSKKALIFHPLSTLSQINLWTGVAEGYFRRSGNNISANLLERSLMVNPSNIVATENNKNSYITDAVKNSKEYQTYVDNLIGDAESAGKKSIHDRQVDSNGITFNSGDLSTSIHGTKSTLVSGEQNSDGTWNIQISIADIYDYDYKSLKEYIDDPKTAYAVGAAAKSQDSEVISNYSILITFSDKRE